MSYITDIFAFQDWIEYDSSITPNEIALWYALVRIFNKLGNPEELSIPISTLIPKCKLSRNSIYKSRNRLKQLGLIDFKDRKGNQSSVYKTIKFRRPTVEKNDTIRNLSSELDENGQEEDLCTKIETQMDTQSDTQMDTQSDTQMDTQMDTQRTSEPALECGLEDLLKIKNKNKNVYLTTFDIHNSTQENLTCECVSATTNEKCKRKSTYCINGKNYCDQHSKEILNEIEACTVKSSSEKTHAAKNDIHSLIDNYSENKELRFELKEYLKMRKAKKVPNTKRAIQLNLDKLSNLADNDEEKIAIVQKTIEHGWTSFFPNSEGKSDAYSNTKQQELSVEDKLKKIKSSYGDVCDLYNTVCSNLPKTNRMSQKRITRLYTLLRSGYSREDIRKVFEIANTSKFLCGKTKNSYFTATLDWLIVKENFEKVLEGNYKSETAENTTASNPKQERKPSYDISNHVKYCEDLLFRTKSP